MTRRTARMAAVAVIGVLMGMAGCQSAEEAPADGAPVGSTMVAVQPEAPHPPGAWMTLDDGPELWADSVAIVRNADGSLRARLLRWGVGHWQVTVQEVRCDTREVRWISDEHWNGDQPIETDATADILDDWQATTPGGPRGRVVDAICRAAGVTI
jgi:hypothetical protein